MSKKRKVWSIIAIVFGGLTVIGSIANLKEYWFSLIVGLGLVALGAWLLISGKKKAQEIAAKKKSDAEQMRAEAAARIAEAEAKKADLNARQRQIVFKATYVEKFQNRIAKQYKKEMNSTGNYLPLYEIKPYMSYDGKSTRYNVLVDDDKIGEAPARVFEELGKAIDKTPRRVSVNYVTSQNENGTWYDVEVTYTYWE